MTTQPKLGEIIEIEKPIEIEELQDLPSIEEQTQMLEPQPESEPIEKLKTKRERCPNGTRKNKKTGKCVKKQSKTKKIQPTLIAKSLEKLGKDCKPPKPLYNEKTNRCVKDNNANRKKIDKINNELNLKSETINTREKIIEIEKLPTIKEQTSVIDESKVTKLFKKIEKIEKEEEEKGELSKKNVKKLNKLLNEKEILNRKLLKKSKAPSFLFPNKDDTDFNTKLIEKKEFQVLEKKKIKNYDDLEKLSEEACNQRIFELLPHQVFVKNFLSFQTPYNSLLLYHGLGTGKTCSAISICEEMRDYLKQINSKNQIIIIASPNVQKNFLLQLTNFKKLENIKGIWNLNACTGNKYLKEINPMNMKGLTKEEIIKLINSLIKKSYRFYGYEEFSNKVERLVNKALPENVTPAMKLKLRKRVLNKNFSNCLIVVDEVHNLRSSETGEKKVANNLLDVAKYTTNLKLLLLSATPIFNEPTEIVWILNLMNANDGRAIIYEKDLFDKNDNLLVDEETGEPYGLELLQRKITGYVSYLRGESPLSFPFKIFPSSFMTQNTLESYIKPDKQLNDQSIVTHLNERLTDLVVVSLKEYQYFVYQRIVESIKDKLPNTSSGLGFQILNEPLSALNIVYPSDLQETPIEKITKSTLKNITGFDGLYKTMTFNSNNKNKFKYRDEIKEKYGEFFDIKRIGNYSAKLKFFLDTLTKTKKGIVLIFSQFIDAGCVPIALALEQLGFSRYKNRNLFETPPTEQVDAFTFSNKNVKHKAKYIMITGQKQLSPNIEEEVAAVTDENNTNGEKIRVIIISRTGTEGIDFKNIRQVHLMEPWYHNNRANQVIGRAVRNCSHKNLPFEERNVEIYKYGSMLPETTKEAADMYVYRVAERKTIKIGNITRIMKETAIDCMLNKDVINSDRVVKQRLITGEDINYKIADEPYSEICDYQEDCNYTCKPFKEKLDVVENSYNESFIIMNVQIIITKVKELFKEFYVMDKDELVKYIRQKQNYPLAQIDTALSFLVDDESNFVFDKLNRRGNIINIGKFYMFQPIELTNKNISVFERNRPIQIKPEALRIPIKEIKIKEQKVSNILTTIIEDYTKAQTPTKFQYGEKNLEWYQMASNSYGRINEVLGITKKQFNRYVCEHILDVLKFKDKVKLYQHVLNNDKVNGPLKQIKSIVESRMILDKFFVIANQDDIEYFIYTNNKLDNAGATDKVKIIDYFASNENSLFNNDNNTYDKLNTIIGLMVNFKNEEIVFKRKNKTRSSKGNRCNQTNKNDINIFIRDELDLPEFLEKGYKTGKAIELCVDQELIMRHYNKTNFRKKIWFLTTEESILADKFNIYNK